MIIGLGGFAKAGKDTVATHLVEKYGFKQLAFAGPLKQACKEIFSFTDEQVHGDLKEVNDEYWGFSPRFALQKVGTECMRDGFDLDIWVKAAGKRIMSEPDTNWVITDVRFPNEASAVVDWGGDVIRINRPAAGASNGIEAHPSEMAMAEYRVWRAIINNNGTLEELYEEVDKVYNTLVGAPNEKV